MKNDLHFLGTSQMMEAKLVDELIQFEYKNLPQIK